MVVEICLQLSNISSSWPIERDLVSSSNLERLSPLRKKVKPNTFNLYRVVKPHMSIYLGFKIINRFEDEMAE